ncbi:hypothetical protein KCU67_g1301, partial [Aureobasidium melanogenum]
MASALPTITTPLMPTTSSQAYLDEVSESLSQARQALDRAVRALESLDRLETTINVPEEYENSSHATFAAQATLVEVIGEELNTLERWLGAVEGLMQRVLEDSTNIASTTTTAVVDEKRNKERALPGSNARYMVVVLLLSASLLATLFALFFVSTQK